MENLWLDQKVTNRLSQTFSKRIKGFKSFARIKTDGLKGESNNMLLCQKTHLTVRPFEIKGSLCGMEKKETCKQSHELWFETELLGGQQMLRSTVNHRSDDNMELGTSVTVQSLWQHWGCLQLAGSQSLTQQEEFQSCNLKKGKFGSLIFPSPPHCASFLQVYSEDNDVCIAA